MMRRSLLILVMCLGSVAGASGQERPFDVEAYQAFLAAHADLDAVGLLSMVATDAFGKRVSTPFAAAAYSDSLTAKYALTPDERLLLDRHGFVVTERLAPSSFGTGFLEIYQRDLPVFVSSDAVLHALHMSYDQILMDTEQFVLLPKLEALLIAVHGALPALADRYAAEPGMQPALRDLDVYLTVARSLLHEAPAAPVWPENRPPVDDLLGLVDGEQPAPYPLFAETCRVIDFSQFTPRGHYTRDPVLTRYFRSMIWLGRTEWYLIGPVTDVCAPTDADVQRQTVGAALLAEAVASSATDALLEEFDAILGFFVGEPDNVTLAPLRTVLAAAGVERASDLLDEARWRRFQDALARQPFAAQRILSQILFSTDLFDPDGLKPASAFLLLGQRFVIDSFITGHVVFDEVAYGPPLRMLPSTQDVLFALGNDASAQVLEPELDRYGYAPNLAALRYLVDGYDDAFWNSTLYNGWLDAIRTLNPPVERADLPEFMQTAAWWQQKMNTQLAAWAQLRHDNLLYAKQSYTGVPGCEFPYSYVEPVPAFFEAAGRLAGRAADRFAALTGVDPALTGRVAAYFGGFKAVTDTLGIIARKELEHVPLDDVEKEFLRRMLFEVENCAPDIGGWYAKLYYGGSVQAMKPDLVVADVHTAPADQFGNMVGWVLHAGTGPLNMAVVTAEVPGTGPVAFLGPVLSYYEHLSTGFERLTDEAWQTAYAAAPSFRPDFVNLYLADVNGNARGEGFSLATGVEARDPSEVPDRVLLAPGYPNPFSDFTVLGFTVAGRQAYQRVELEVYDVRGRRLRHLLSDALPPGNYTVRWDGGLDDGARAASGVYLCRLRIGDQHATRAMTLIR